MRKILILLAVSLLASCKETPPPAPPEPLQFTGPSYTLNVAEIHVAQDYRSPRRPPNVEHLSDITPAEAVKQWAGTRLIAAGHANSLEVDIKEASIVHKELPKQKTGIEGWFTTEQTEEYEGTLEVDMKIYNLSNPLPVAHLSVLVHQTLTLPEDATVLDRERAYHQMTINLMKAAEPAFDANIHQYFANYLM